MAEAGSESIDLAALANQTLAQFQSEKYQECLESVDAIHRHGASGSGLHYIAAVCCFHMENYTRGLDELQKERERPDGAIEAQELFNQIQAESRQNPTLNRDLTPGRYLISGLPPGDSGTGKFLSALVPIAIQSGFTPIHPSPDNTFSRIEKIKVCEIRNSEVVLLHPQLLGFELFRQLVESNVKISMYVLDNSFFCIRSYNYRPERQGECLDCLGNIRQCHSTCQPHPATTTRDRNLEFLEWLQSVASTISFFCQTESQKRLLEKHFGSGIKSTVVGMFTPEYQLASTERVDVVFHAEALAAKGLRFILEMAARLPEYSFLIPASREQVDRERSGAEVPHNVRCVPMRWGDGLQQAVQSCRLVLCPSQWSAPVEGALMKSLYYNGNVGVMATNFGFERELPDDIILRLQPNSHLAADQVRAFLDSKNCNRERAKVWVEQYNRSVALGAVFG